MSLSTKQNVKIKKEISVILSKRQSGKFRALMLGHCMFLRVGVNFFFGDMPVCNCKISCFASKKLSIILQVQKRIVFLK